MQVRNASIGTLLAILASATVHAAPGQTPPGPTGTVVGTVFDSTRSVPLRNAKVVLWNTRHQTTTDDAGHFRLQDVPEGDYSVVFFHNRLARLGVSTGAYPVTVRSDEDAEVRLTTPSMFTIHTSHCAMERPTAGARPGSAAGRVEDSRTGVALPRAQVTLTWRDPGSGRVRERTAQADEEGWYRFCRIPREGRVGATAHFLDRSATRKEFSLAGSSAARVDFRLVGPLKPSDVTGTIRDAEDQNPVRDAEVSLLGTEYRTITNEQGHFRFSGVPPGTYSVEVSHLAYGERTETVDVGNGLEVDLDVDVAMKPIDLDPIEVTAESRASADPLAMGGHVITRSEIDEVRHRSRDVADLLRSQNVRGLMVRRQGNLLCVGFMPGQVRMFKSNDCYPAVVFIDGVRASDPQVAMNLQSEAIERVILYRPVEAGTLFGLGSAAGVIKIFTRSARRPRG